MLGGGGFGLLWGCGGVRGGISPLGGAHALPRRWAGAMDDLRLHYRFLSWRRRIREIREVRAVRYQERSKHVLVDGDTLRWGGVRGLRGGGGGCEVTRSDAGLSVCPCPSVQLPRGLG